jgi:hypothetical protein
LNSAEKLAPDSCASLRAIPPLNPLAVSDSALESSAYGDFSVWIPPAGSMKGAVKKNISPQTGHRDERLLVAASPLLRADELLIRLWRFRRFITTWSLSSETEKHDGLDCRP